MSEIPNTKTYKTRIQNKIDTTENWNKAQNFKPLKGEIIIYADPGVSPKIKIGDGNTLVGDLPFSGAELEAIPNEEIDEICGQLIEYGNEVSL